MLYALATHQEWQEELRREAIDLNKDVFEFEDVERMEKTGWTMKEALRMHPARVHRSRAD